MLNTPNLKLLNQPSQKFRSRYIGPYTITEKMSSQAYYKLNLPLNMKLHSVFHIGLLKEFNFSLHGSEFPNDIPSSNDFIYGDDTFHVHSIIDHKIAPQPQTYAKSPTILCKAN